MSPAYSDRPSEMAGEGPSAAEISVRAARLGLGSRATANTLLIGAPRADWIAAAGGSEAPGDLLWPLGGGRLMRAYGSGRRGRHRALDIGAREGTEIRAADRGLVAYADSQVRGYGRLVMLVHPGGLVTFYAHASELAVRPGQIVERGEIIGRVGHSGRAHGDHLHFELWRDGIKIDPAPMLVSLPEGQSVPVSRLAPARFRRVRRGDTVASIARENCLSVRRLLIANGLSRRRRLRVGQSLLIPTRGLIAGQSRLRRPRPHLGAGRQPSGQGVGESGRLTR